MRCLLTTDITKLKMGFETVLKKDQIYNKKNLLTEHVFYFYFNPIVYAFLRLVSNFPSSLFRTGHFKRGNLTLEESELGEWKKAKIVRSGMEIELWRI